MALLEIAAPAYAIDGDTLRVGSDRIRLLGVDAPELHQTCGSLACGEAAKAWMARQVEGKLVVCNGKSRDRYRRLLAVCRVNGVDLNAAIVRSGWAVAYRRYSKAYVGPEESAREAGLGMWAVGFDFPEEWRKTHTTR